MKNVALLIFLLSLTSILTGQEFKIAVVPTLSNLSYFKDDVLLYSKARFGAGVEADYLFISDKKIRFGIGAGIQNNHVRLVETILEGATLIINQINERAIITSFRLESFYYINDQFFVSLIPAFDYHFKHPKERIGDQTGLSLSFGLGNGIELNKSLSLSVEPRLTINNIIPFKDKDLKYSLTTTGLRVGLIFGRQMDK
jgi:hypothetical protein